MKRETMLQELEQAVLAVALRQFRSREQCRIIWRDFNGLAAMAETTGDLSAMADACIDAGLDWLETLARQATHGTALYALALHRSSEAGERLFSLARDTGEDAPEEVEVLVAVHVAQHQRHTQGVAQGLENVHYSFPFRHGLELIDGILRTELTTAGVRVEREYDPDLGPVVTDPDQLRQVLLNLLKNAADAVDGDGVVTVRTRRAVDRIILEVADDGVGMGAGFALLLMAIGFFRELVGKGSILSGFDLLFGGEPLRGLVLVDGGYSHEFTTAQVHYFLEDIESRDMEHSGAEAVGEVISTHVIARPHSNIDQVLPLGRKEQADAERQQQAQRQPAGDGQDR